MHHTVPQSCATDWTRRQFVRGLGFGMLGLSLPELLRRQALAQPGLTGRRAKSCIMIFLFGGITIREFALIMFIGITSGTYSSIFNAVPLLVAWEKGEIGNFFRRLLGRPTQAPA